MLLQVEATYFFCLISADILIFFSLPLLLFHFELLLLSPVIKNVHGCLPPLQGLEPVSYTHLDVYKRQELVQVFDTFVDQYYICVLSLCLYKLWLCHHSCESKFAFSVLCISLLKIYL